MTDDIKLGLSDLDFSDDLDVALDNETYQDQAAPAPPAAGDYLFRLTGKSVYPATYRGGEKKGQPIKDKNGYPILTLGVVEIVEGLGDGATRKVGLFQDIKTAGYERDGKNVSQLGDLSRALGLSDYSGLRAGLDALAEADANGGTFGASLDWESGFDKEFVDAAVKQLGLEGVDKSDMTDAQKKLSNAIQYRYSRVQGMKFADFNATSGRFLATFTRGNVVMKVGNDTITVEVPSRQLEARAVIPVFFNDIKFISRERVDSGRVTFGPKAIKPVAAAA